MSCILGIDPGKSGAVCVLDNSDNEVSLHFWPLGDFDFWHFHEMIKDYRPKHIFIEKAQSMPKQGIASTFSYGMNFGKIIGWIEATEIPFTMITPREWTKELHRGIVGVDPKAKSAEAVQRLFPVLDMNKIAKTKPIRSGMIDALLIAEYGRRIFK